jgi:hypothetical protein
MKSHAILLLSILLCTFTSAQTTAVAYLDRELGDYVIEIPYCGVPDKDAGAYIVPEYADFAFPADFVDGKIVLRHPSQLFMRASTSHNYVGAYLENGEVQFTEVVQLHAPDIATMISYKFGGHVLQVEGKIGTDGYNLLPYYGRNDAIVPETFFAFYDVSKEHGKQTSYFDATTEDGMKFQGTLSMEDIMSKGILSFAITLQDQNGIPRISDFGQEWILLQDGFKVTSNASRFGVYQVFWPESSAKNLKVFTLNGQQVKSCAVSSGEQLIFDDLPTGMYIFSIEGYSSVRVIRG